MLDLACCEVYGSIGGSVSKKLEEVVKDVGLEIDAAYNLVGVMEYIVRAEAWGVGEDKTVG